MLDVTFFIVDSFTQTRYAGNPAGVILPEQPLTEAQMLAIAGELHLESAFAIPVTDGSADFQVAYYTGAARVPLCGHDTIALAAVLAQTGRMRFSGTVRLATDVGILSVSVADDGLVTMEQALPLYGPLVDADATADALGLSLSEIAETSLPIQIVSTGTPFLIVPIVHRAALNALAPDMAVLTAFGDSLNDFIAGFLRLDAGNGKRRCLYPCPLLLSCARPDRRPSDGDGQRGSRGLSRPAWLSLARRRRRFCNFVRSRDTRWDAPAA